MLLTTQVLLIHLVLLTHLVLLIDLVLLVYLVLLMHVGRCACVIGLHDEFGGSERDDSYGNALDIKSKIGWKDVEERRKRERRERSI